MSETIFELQDVHYSYLGKNPALCGIDMTIRSGERVAVIGANGTGKSTLIHLLDGLLFPDRGVVKAFGEELSERALQDEERAHRFRRRVGMVFQNADIQLFCPTVKEDILFGPLQLDRTEAEAEKRLHEVAKNLTIEHLLERAPYELSLGEKRKVAIASVLAIDPEVLLLDEPTAGLDPSTTARIIDFILAPEQKDKTIVVATHDLHLAHETADRIVVIGENRKVVRQGTPDEVLTDEGFLGEHNLLHIHSHRHGGNLHRHPHSHAHLKNLPEHEATKS